MSVTPQASSLHYAFWSLTGADNFDRDGSKHVTESNNKALPPWTLQSTTSLSLRRRVSSPQYSLSCECDLSQTETPPRLHQEIRAYTRAREVTTLTTGKVSGLMLAGTLADRGTDSKNQKLTAFHRLQA